MNNNISEKYVICNKNDSKFSAVKKAMKYVIVFFVSVLLLSCSPYKTIHSPYVAIYRMDGVGEIPPQYLILKITPKVFEIYLPVIQSCIVGQWNIDSDTLYLFPKYEYYDINDEIKINEITTENLSIVSIPQRYLIKNDCLIDKSDYRILSTEFFSFSNNIDNNDISYKRIKIKEKVEKYHLR